MHPTTYAAIQLFLSPQNREQLRAALQLHSASLTGAMESAARQYERDMMGSDPIGDKYFQLDALNAEFLARWGGGESASYQFNQSEYGTTTRQYRGESANTLLEQWQKGDRRPSSLREDQHGERGDTSAGRLSRGRVADVAIEYSDHSTEGVNWAVEDFQRRIVGHGLNSENRGYVGDGTAATDERLVAMRDRLPPGHQIDWRGGTQDAVSRAEVRLHRRRVDPTAESVSGTERDCISYRLGMDDLREKVAHHRAYTDWRRAYTN